MALFDVAADSYVRFMGRFSTPLSVPFADIGLAGVDSSARVLDVGCGPGILTSELVKRQGEANVSAVDPVEAFVQAAAASYPAADVRVAAAEALPYPDDTFGATLAQLVVHFMSDPVAGVGEMVRVTAPGGRVSACVWDNAGGTGASSSFWRVVQRYDPEAEGEKARPGSWGGDLTRMFTDAGLQDVEETLLTVRRDFATFEEWWEPFTLGVGPAGAYVRSLNQIEQTGLMGALREEHGGGPITIQASAWTATGLV
ncbi:class I SAM-dependent methyltransferase [Nocardioides bizhenqiangii]|uniref:Class I SAM-dependent methyltransferase n=1 Tax=Nocardioides bizhenqiangii TaxID=3095076 RepID=A0ABZ0ZSM5_9ACTN|nr:MULTISPECIES: class I SAM-dependent methyltransferase [unclassified Nocardioides]MDZ5621998.1 class I SAM-dependent methyltransferase [Nocardioides sp. HM23]WQQ27325.1 class I SAM-dependent methyltransferase [Nocardioides sp. HM61]